MNWLKLLILITMYCFFYEALGNKAFVKSIQNRIEPFFSKNLNSTFNIIKETPALAALSLTGLIDWFVYSVHGLFLEPRPLAIGIQGTAYLLGFASFFNPILNITNRLNNFY